MQFWGENNEESISDWRDGRADGVSDCTSSPVYNNDEYNEYSVVLTHLLQ